uniref:Uncharacterized protein n=1 Tax=Anguilla anguilla TaxID=7936 RepID=A0A0E9T1L8_ANGAN
MVLHQQRIHRFQFPEPLEGTLLTTRLIVSHYGLE